MVSKAFLQVRNFCVSPVYCPLARRAGKLMKEASLQPKHVQIKEGGPADLVTETDKAVQEHLFAQIRKTFPTHQLIGEETSPDDAIITDEPTWIIDPVDGTTNFIHGFPFTSISIGFTLGRKTIVGVIYNPITEQMYSAAVGLGARLNGSLINVSGTTQSLQDAMILTELGVNLERMAAKTRLCQQLITYPVHAVRMLGCASMNLCTVASGAADAYIEEGIKCWDIAAGVLIVREAGGWVSDFNGLHGDAFELSKRQVVVACSESVGMELLEILKKTIAS